MVKPVDTIPGRYNHLMIVLFLIMTLMSLTCHAQYGSFGVTDGRSIGMGNTYNATTFDLYAIGKNPGLLSVRDGNYKVSLIFPNITAQQYGINNTLSTIDYYATNKLRSDGLVTINKEKFNIALENEGMMFMDMLLGFFSAAYHPNDRIGSFAFSMTDYMTGYLLLPDVVLDIHYGKEIPDGEFALDEFRFKSWWIRTYALSYSRFVYKDQNIYRSAPGLIKYITAGITAKYVLTYAYSDMTASGNAYYSTGTHILSGNYQASAQYAFSEDLEILNNFDPNRSSRPPGFMALKPAGRGFGIDIGAGAELRNGLVLGLAITDIGSIQWSGTAIKSEYDGYLDISGLIDDKTLDSLSSNIAINNNVSDKFSTPLPGAVRLGVALKFEKMFSQFPGEMLMGVDYNQGLNDQPSNYTAPRFSIGFEYRYKPKWPILLGGYTYDLLDIGRGSIGLGYKSWFWEVYVSTIDVFAIVSGRPRLSLSVVARWKLFSGEMKKRAPECY